MISQSTQKAKRNQNSHEIPKGANVREYLDMEKFYMNKPALLNKYYETNLIELVDQVSQQFSKEQLEKKELYLKQKNQKHKKQNAENISKQQEQIMIKNSTPAVHHQTDRLNQDLEVNDYKFSTLLGRGAHSVVRQAKDKTEEHEVYAVKILWLEKIRKKYFIKPNELMQMISNEIILLKKLKHPNIIGFKDAIYLKEKQRMFVILEHCSKGPMTKLVNNNLTLEDKEWWEVVRHYFKGFVAGIHSMHQKGVVHRDIKPDNLLVNKYDVLKIIDFNVSTHCGQNGQIKVTNKFIGTKGYAAPELILDLAKEKICDGRKIDVWAMGITLLELLERKHPYPVKTLHELVKVLKKFQMQKQLHSTSSSKRQQIQMSESSHIPSICLNEEYPPALKDLIRKMLRYENSQRILTEKILEHEWLKQ